MESTRDTPAIEIDPTVLRELRRSRAWILFVAFVLYGTVALMAVGVVTSFVGSHDDTMLEESPFLTIAMIFLILVFYGSPGYVMHQYARAIRRVLAEPTSENLTTALHKEAHFWRLIGVMTICFLGLALAMAIGSFFA